MKCICALIIAAVSLVGNSYEKQLASSSESKVKTIPATASLSSDADTLRLRLRVGESLRFRSVTRNVTVMAGISAEYVATAVWLMRALEQSEGWTKVRVTTEEVETEGEDAAMVAALLEGMKDIVYTFEVDETGRTRRIELENADALDPMFRQMFDSELRPENSVGFMGVQFPNGPVDVGSNWAVEIDAEKMFSMEFFTNPDGKITVLYDVVGFEDLEDRRSVKIKSVMDGAFTMEFGAAGSGMDAVHTREAESTYWIDVQDGTVTKMVSEGTIKSDFGGNSTIQTISTTTERVK